MQDRFKFRAILKTDTHIIITDFQPYYIFDNGYLVNIDDVQKPFEKKYPDDCFWEFLEEIEKQENCQEVSADSEVIIFNSFDGLIQCTGLKDTNGKLIYENDIVTDVLTNQFTINFDEKYLAFLLTNIKTKESMVFYPNIKLEIIGNIYENPELLEVENDQ